MKEKLKKFKVGEYFEGCNFHPILVTENSGDNVVGISLINGSHTSCSVRHCGCRKISVNEAIKIALNWDKHPYKDWTWKKHTNKEIEELKSKAKSFWKFMGWKIK